ncbi:Phytoene dehydrogenase-like oxidoreductase [Frankia sp. AiPs1]|uniref:NAD(P)/FAD-dependent oxidoreductase n=1 Tax=Frankia sp. AiPa1 TaxID=573492 RepID=UPI00202B018E|nr:NAD(P)/FAD-dependent oxidoreductase [Frankia sp. AiPa1]MCL9762030.1 FAD-dependent oxidoreductase [Frankia sp. AiPa1]
MRTVDVAVVGAGLAGLSAATLLAAEGLEVAVWEAADDVGGRVRTDEVDGFLLDRGFQVLLPAYPEVVRQIDLPALRVRPFARAVLLRDGVRSVSLGDPSGGMGALAGLVPGRALRAADLVRLAALTSRDRWARPGDLVAGPERPTRADLLARGLSVPAVDGVLAPVLRGIFLEERLATSARFFHLVWRSFATRPPVLPEGGMAALPRQLAARLRPGTVRLGRPADIVTRTGVRSRDGESLVARAVVVATDGTTAARLVPGIAEPAWHGVTTYYFRTDVSPLRRGMLVVEGATDSRRRLTRPRRTGPVINTVVLNEVAPSYAPAGAALIAASVLGASPDSGASPDGGVLSEGGVPPGGLVPADEERAVRTHLGALYGTDTGDWTLLARYPVPRALPALSSPAVLRRPVRTPTGVYVCGDHRDTPSIQGALFSGRRAAEAVLADLGISRTDRPWTGVPRSDISRADPRRWDAAPADDQRADAVRPDAVRPDAARPDAARADAGRPEVSDPEISG